MAPLLPWVPEVFIRLEKFVMSVEHSTNPFKFDACTASFSKILRNSFSYVEVSGIS